MYSETVMDGIMMLYRNLRKLFPGLCLHQGRTDQNGSHRDWINKCGWGFFNYHYHHGLSAHLHPEGICPFEKQAFVMNPYTGKKIALGSPYVFQGKDYYSLNLVCKALTVHDGMGVELALNNTGGIFYVCSTWDSTSSRLGEEFTFSYPKIILAIRDNTLFYTEIGEIELLCHTKKAAMDDIDCYAYISLDTVKEYMTKDGCFSNFYESRNSTWVFELADSLRPSVTVTAPKSNVVYHVGDSFTVTADIWNLASAKLTLNTHKEQKDNLESQRAVAFTAYELMVGDVGDITIEVEGSSPYGLMNNISQIQIHVKGATEGEKIAINDAITGYSEQSDIGGRYVEVDGTELSDYRYSVISDVIKPYYGNTTSPDWYMPEHMGGVYVNNNAYEASMTPYAITSDDVSKNKHGVFINKEKRYWIAVGPTIMNASYDVDGSVNPATMKYGCRIDLLLGHVQTHQQVWLYCILGDIKNHTFSGIVNGTYIDGRGIFQTGFDPQGNWESEHMDASIIEIMGMNHTEALRELAKFMLIRIVVYD